MNYSLCVFVGENVNQVFMPPYNDRMLEIIEARECVCFAVTQLDLKNSSRNVAA
jgi:hypothetical protein